MLISFWKVL